MKPIVNSLLLCDMVIRDRNTNKLSIINYFTNLCSKQVPFIHSSMSVVAIITEVNGKYNCNLKIVSMRNQKTIVNLPGTIEHHNPTHNFEFIFDLQQVAFENFGMYSVEFWVGEDLVGATKLLVLELPK